MTNTRLVDGSRPITLCFRKCLRKYAPVQPPVKGQTIDCVFRANTYKSVTTDHVIQHHTPAMSTPTAKGLSSGQHESPPISAPLIPASPTPPTGVSVGSSNRNLPSRQLSFASPHNPGRPLLDTCLSTFRVRNCQRRGTLGQNPTCDVPQDLSDHSFGRNAIDMVTPAE